MKWLNRFLALVAGLGLPVSVVASVAPQPIGVTHMGYLFAVLSMLALGCLGILGKLAMSRGCTSLAANTALFITSTLITGAYVASAKGASFAPPPSIVAIALAFGVVTALSSWAFLNGLKFGKISTSWVVISLSAAVPTVASTVLYHERLGLQKITVLLLVGAAILLLWKDMQEERSAAADTASATPRTGARRRMWLRMMLLAFIFNGLSPFGLRIVAGMGLAGELTPVYLFYWYLGGTIFVLAWAGVLRERIPPKAVLIGSGMALCSVLGQFLMGRALAEGAPGNVVFPLSVGGNIFIVAAGGVLFFKEVVGRYGKAGIFVGLLAAVLLSLGG
jgi:drug/metabolite transporter (DMT)-like permease